MTNKPNVLICDDESDWADLIEVSIQNKYSTSKMTNPDNWNKQIGSSNWDAIIVDVQLIGTDVTGVDHAERSILDYGVTSPIIIMSGVVNLEEFQQKYGKMFFDYISKDEFNKSLLESLDKACEHSMRLQHVKDVLLLFCKKFGILDTEFPISLLKEYGNDDVLQSFKSNNGKTLRDLIDSILYGVKHKLDKMGKIIFAIIQHQRPK